MAYLGFAREDVEVALATVEGDVVQATELLQRNQSVIPSEPLSPSAPSSSSEEPSTSSEDATGMEYLSIFGIFFWLCLQADRLFEGILRNNTSLHW